MRRALFCLVLAAGCGSITRVAPDGNSDSGGEGGNVVDGGDLTPPPQDTGGDARPDLQGESVVEAPVDRPADSRPDLAPDRPPDTPIDLGVDRPDVPVDMGIDMSVDVPAEVRPDVPCNCPAIYMPVCGADGKTYVNMCAANCAGVTVVHNGPCMDAGTPSCVTDNDCVLYPPYTGGCCGACRVKGEPRPQMVSCIIPCDMPYTACLCVNNRCIPKGTAAE